MQRQRKFGIDIKTASNQARTIKTDLACPYTSGTATKGSVCPLTGIDVRRAAHSQVLDQIDKTVRYIENLITRPADILES